LYCILTASGGRISVQRKHAEIQSSHFNSCFFITTNVYPDFGDGRDAEAIRKRLSVFETVALQKKDPAISSTYIIHMNTTCTYDISHSAYLKR